MTAATAHRGADINRIGTVRVRFTDLPALPDPPPDADDEDGRRPTPADHDEDPALVLVLTVPPHTAMDPEKAAVYLAAQIKPHVLMYLPPPIGPQDYTVTVRLDHSGAGTVTLTEVLRGAARVRRQPAQLGAGTIDPVAPPPPEEPPVRRRRR